MGLRVTFGHLDMEGQAIVAGLAVEADGVAAMCLGHIGDFYPVYGMRLIPSEGEEVQRMLDILHAVEMAVDIHIIVFGHDGGDQFGLIRHIDP